MDLSGTRAGLPTRPFRHDGQLTKREIRAATLAQLAPFPNARLWDVGAGCGSIAIEWMRSGMGTRAIAIEAKPERLAMIRENAEILGVPDLDIVEGEAPQRWRLEDARRDLHRRRHQRRGTVRSLLGSASPGGRLVANAVTIEGEANLSSFAAATVVISLRIQVARAAPVGRYCGWKSLMPVTMWTVVKGGAHDIDLAPHPPFGAPSPRRGEGIWPTSCRLLPVHGEKVPAGG